MARDTPLPLFDFADATAAKQWQTVNDGVMGGVSEGKFRITAVKTLEFSRTLSLENNGGFASVRRTAKVLGLEKGDNRPEFGSRPPQVGRVAHWVAKCNRPGANWGAELAIRHKSG